jgi:hypothetical protein
VTMNRRPSRSRATLALAPGTLLLTADFMASQGRNSVGK